MDALGLGRELVDDGGVPVVAAALLARGVAVFAAGRAAVVAPGALPVGASSAAVLFDEVPAAPAARGGATIETAAARFRKGAVGLDPDGPLAAAVLARWEGAGKRKAGRSPAGACRSIARRAVRCPWEFLLFRLELPTRVASDAWTGRTRARRPVTSRQRGRSAAENPRVDRPSTGVRIGRHPTDAGSGGIDGGAGEPSARRGRAGLSQIGSSHVRPEVAHLLGDDGERQPVFRVAHEFPHPLLGVAMAQAVRPARLPERFDAGAREGRAEGVAAADVVAPQVADAAVDDGRRRVEPPVLEAFGEPARQQHFAHEAALPRHGVDDAVAPANFMPSAAVPVRCERSRRSSGGCSPGRPSVSSSWARIPEAWTISVASALRSACRAATRRICAGE